MMQHLSLVQKKRMVNITSWALIAVVFLVIFRVPVVHAEADNTQFVTWINDITEGIMDIVTDTLGFTNNGKGYNGFYQAIATQDISASPVAAIMQGFQFIGAAFAFVIAFMHLMKNLEQGQDAQESVYKMLIELTIVMMVIMNTSAILQLMTNLGTVIVNSVAEAFAAQRQEYQVNAEEVLESLTGKPTGGPVWAVKAAIALILPYMLSWIVKIAAKFVVLSLMFELAIRQALTPLFIADIYDEGLRSPGAKHLKQYLAVYIKMAICLIVCMLSEMLTISAMSNTIYMLMEIIAINFTSIGVMFKAGEYVNSFI